MPADTPTVVVDVVRDWLDYATVIGTIGAATVAALAVRQTGRQGRAQQRQLLDARERDIAERRADFELDLLLQLTRLTRRAFGWGSHITETEEMLEARALLLALPPDLLPVLRATLAPIDDTLARDVLAQFRDDNHYARDLQRAIDRELRDAIFARRDVDPSPPA